MIERIKQLEAISRRLDPDSETRKRVRNELITYTERFLERLPEANAYNDDKAPARKLRSSPISEDPATIGELLALADESVDSLGINAASAGHLGYIPGGGLYYSALGDYWADVTNRYAGVAYAGPGAVEMENMLLDWMAELVGYPADSGGNLASGEQSASF